MSVARSVARSVLRINQLQPKNRTQSNQTTKMKNPNPENFPPAQHGYVIMSMREPGERCPIGAIDDRGDYKTAFVSNTDPVDMAVYPTKEAAAEAIKRAAGDTDPLVFDGLTIASLLHTKNPTAAQCWVHGFVTNPAGRPACTDFEAA